MNPDDIIDYEDYLYTLSLMEYEMLRPNNTKKSEPISEEARKRQKQKDKKYFEKLEKETL